MKQCPKCASQVESEAICHSCGFVLLGGGVTPEEKPAADQAALPAAAASTAAAPAKQPHLFALLLVIVVTGAGSLMLLATATRGPATVANEESAPGRPDAAVGSNSPMALNQVPPASSPPAQWSMTVPPPHAGLGRNTVVFELAADQDIDVWRKRVRPVLTVRCAGNSTEVFVVTHSAAAIEPDTNRHTVKVAFDGETPDVQMWEHSVDHDAIFAPDGRALSRRIASSRKMWVTFTPFNAPLAVTPFTVDGFAERLKVAGKKCA